MDTQYPVRTVDLAVLRDNVGLIRRQLRDDTLLMAVVKADAYGHGIVQVARNAVSAGADWLAVARAGEGVLLRQAGLKVPILVLGAASGQEIGEGVKTGLTMTVTDPRMVHAVERWASSEGVTGCIHLKIDTGMGRIGVRTEDEVKAVLRAVQASPHVSLTGVFTHFADADGQAEAYTCRQIERFSGLCALLPGNIIRHCANSAAIHRFPGAEMDMVRAGISMYGYPPVPTDLPLQPVMDWKTAVTYVKDVQPGEMISYGCTFTAERPMKMATVACGYGDGYHRCSAPYARVIIRDRLCPVVGRICMDQMMVDVSDLAEVEPGDEVILLGKCEGAAIDAEDLGRWAGTISYEVLLAATERVYYRWIHDCES